MPEQNTRGLLERLASDDQFRSLMEQDPVTALAEYGFTIDPAIAPKQVNLPSKQEITDGIELLAKQIEASYGFIIFCR